MSVVTFQKLSEILGVSKCISYRLAQSKCLFLTNSNWFPNIKIWNSFHLHKNFIFNLQNANYCENRVKTYWNALVRICKDLYTCSIRISIVVHEIRKKQHVYLRHHIFHLSKSKLDRFFLFLLMIHHNSHILHKQHRSLILSFLAIHDQSPFFFFFFFLQIRIIPLKILSLISEWSSK